MSIIMKIADYQNGNLHTTLMSDGTKIHTTEDDEFNPSFAESMDVHISSMCDNECPMCYANCTRFGEFGDLNMKWINTLHPGTELAVNLNFPIHPDFYDFANKLKDSNVVLNITVNQKHFEQHEDVIAYLYKYHLINGIGISLTNATNEFVAKVKKYRNAVIHVINGIFSPDDFKVLKDNNLKLLILGYKDIGRGLQYKRRKSLKLSLWQRWLNLYIDKVFEGFKIVSFDNLALEQLNIEDKVSKEKWNTLYCGNDGDFSFFINTVSNYFSKNSLSDIHYPINDKSVDDMFNIIRKEIESNE